MRKINDIRLFHQKVRNGVHSLVLLGAMASLLSLLGWLFAGPEGLVWALFIGIGLLAISPALSPRLVLRLYGARPLSPDSAPRLYAALRALAQRAALPRLPVLYYLPSAAVNAFAVGSRNAAGIAVTDGLLKTLDMREISAVMAHEVGHLKHNDLWILNISNIIGRVTSFFSLVGQLLLLFNLPLLLVSGQHISWMAILVLILAPTITMMLQLALSRTREFQADLSAAELTGDPKELAAALLKIERHQTGSISSIFLPGYRRAQPDLLRTHPHVAERVKRLQHLSEDVRGMPPQPQPPVSLFAGHGPVPQVRRHPGWRRCGFRC